MRLHFASRMGLLILAGFLAVASQAWTGDTLQWLVFGGGVATIAIACADAMAPDRAQRGIDGLAALLGAFMIVTSFAFSGTDLTWWTLACGCALAVLAAIGLVLHEMRTERVVHELSVTPQRESRIEAGAGAH